MKRLLSMGTSMSADQCLAVLALFRQSLVVCSAQFTRCMQCVPQKYEKLSALIENDAIATGLFQPYIDDPERCNAFASSAWELALLAVWRGSAMISLHMLQEHFNPVVAGFARHIASGMTTCAYQRDSLVHSHSAATRVSILGCCASRTPSCTPHSIPEPSYSIRRSKRRRLSNCANTCEYSCHVLIDSGQFDNNCFLINVPIGNPVVQTALDEAGLSV